jgi:hypothetical protein
MTKQKSLSRLDTGFLRELASYLNRNRNNSHTYYAGKDRDYLLNLLSNRLTTAEVSTVRKQYLMCLDVRETAQTISPDSVTDIQTAVECYFDESGVYEVKVGPRVCDLVFPEELVAVEIKSATDRVDRATEQIADYREWGDEVFLAYDSEHSGRIPPQLQSSGVGLLEYSDGSVRLIRDAEEHCIPPEKLLSQMTYQDLLTISKSHGVSSGGGKNEIVTRLSDKVTKSEARAIFSNYLRNRGHGR